MPIESRVLTLILSLIEGQQPTEGCSVTLTLGDYQPVHLRLPSAPFLLLFLLTHARESDEEKSREEHLCGFRPTTRLAVIRAAFLNNRHVSDNSYIRRLVKKVRDTIKAGIAEFEVVNNIRFEHEPTIIETDRKMGYRTGNIVVMIDDHNLQPEVDQLPIERMGPANAPSTPTAPATPAAPA